MAQPSKFKEFPDLGSKLAAPPKKSVFERQKAEAEAKRQREQEETAAVYEDFVKSFDDADDDASSGGGGVTGLRSGNVGAPRRHFSTASSVSSGRGGRASSGPGSLGPPQSSISRKRAYDGSQTSQRPSREGLFAYEDSPRPVDAKTAFQTSDDEESSSRTRNQEQNVPRPTLRLSSLPPGTSPSVIKSLLPDSLSVEGIRIVPPSGPASRERRSLSAIVSLAKETPAFDIDTAVSALQNRYLGRGFYLSLSRHLSSAAIGLDGPSLGLSSSTSSMPFGAKPIPQAPNSHFGRAPPSSTHRGGFAPPASYSTLGSSQLGRGAPSVQVNVAPPSDLRQLKLIHKTVEALLTHGPEFEALLMSRKDVQQDEKWAWIWDSRSVGGVWYRWRIWDILTGAGKRRQPNGSKVTTQYIFESGAPWALPERGLPYEYTTSIEEFVSDSDYDSSEDDDSGDEGARRSHHQQSKAPGPDGISLDGEDQAYLNPLQKAKLAHLLVRLPTTNAKLRRGDVARITAFAIRHAGEGADEVVQMITDNVESPFAFSGAVGPKMEKDDTLINDEYEMNEEEKKAADKEDTSSSKLVGLYIISDILSTSSTSGVRHAWRYRQLFEMALRQKQVFEGLGRLDKTMQWGRLRAEKWKRSVGSILTLWESWCVFPQASQEHFASVFTSPPLTAEEEAANAEGQKTAAATASAKSRWKTVDDKTHEQQSSAGGAAGFHKVSLEPGGDTMDMDIDGVPMEDDGDIDGVLMEEEEEESDDADGAPMDEDDESAAAYEDVNRLEDNFGSNGNSTRDVDTNQASSTSSSFKMGAALSKTLSNEPLARPRRQRPKAEDMFADSDEE